MGAVEVMLLLNILSLIVVKTIDSLLNTSKTLLTQKNKSLQAAIVTILSNIIFYTLIVKVANSGDDIAMYAVSFGSGIGTYLAIKINNKLSKERTYVNVILSDNKDAMIELRDFLMENKITNIATDAYTKDWNKTLSITAYAETKEESKILDEYIKSSEIKFKRLINKK